MASHLPPLACRQMASFTSAASSFIPTTRRLATRQSIPRIARQQQSRHRNTRFYSSSAPGGGGGQIKFWPFFAVIGLGTAGYIALAKSRVDMPDKIEAPQTSGQLSAPAKDTPTFSPDDVTVLFVLGGPGAGKGTQCSKLVSQHDFTHLSAGDLLRAEQERAGSQFGEMIKDYIKNGLIVPMEVTVQLLENAMTEAMEKKAGAAAGAGSKKPTGKFLIDGFPRKLDQAHKFEESVCPAKLVLFFDCPEEVMESRLLERGKTSGRADDNAESIRKRFRTFIETSMPVVDYYDKQGKVIKVDGTKAPDTVFATTEKRLKDQLGSL